MALLQIIAFSSKFVVILFFGSPWVFISTASLKNKMPRIFLQKRICNSVTTKKIHQILFLTAIFLFNMQNLQAKSYEKAILAGGCFWGVEELFRNLNGVIETKVGYTGGVIENPTYETVKTGLTGHAESILIIFDAEKISYEKILKFFFTIHDPTQLNRQQNDIGSQYRSEIFYLDDKQKEIAHKVINQANASGVFKKPVVTALSKASKFYEAEDYHQDYLQKNPNGYTCHQVRSEWKF